MPDSEGLALGRVAGLVGSLGDPERATVVEVGAYCGRSTLYLAHGILMARAESQASGNQPQTTVFSVDHHRGSEENQAGWEHHDTSLVNPETSRMDTLGHWRTAVEGAGVEPFVVALVGDSATIASRFAGPAGLVFVDGGHGAEPAWADYRGWAPIVAVGGWLAIHDVFPDPADGGRPPFEIYCDALASGAFEEVEDLGCGSLRVLERTSGAA